MPKTIILSAQSARNSDILEKEYSYCSSKVQYAQTMFTVCDVIPRRSCIRKQWINFTYAFQKSGAKPSSTPTTKAYLSLICVGPSCLAMAFRWSQEALQSISILEILLSSSSKSTLEARVIEPIYRKCQC